MSKQNVNSNIFDIKQGLEHYIPSLLDLIEGDIRWTSLQKILHSRFSEYADRHDKGERFELRLTIYSLTISAAKGNNEHIQFLSFIDNVFKRLTTCLTATERNYIKTNISNLIEFDNKFLNYLGELCVLNCLVTSGLYKLDKTEFRLKSKGKGIDFRMVNIQNQNYFLVEVLNIELPDNKVINHSVLQEFLSRKFQDKLEDTDKSGILDYTIIPVIWGGRDNVNNILKVKDFYEQTNFSMNRIQTPLVYMLLKSGDRFFNKFGSILNCLTIDI